MLHSFYLLINAWTSYNDGLLQIYGNDINNVEMVSSPTPDPVTTPGGGGGNGGGGGGGNATGYGIFQVKHLLNILCLCPIDVFVA